MYNVWMIKYHEYFSHQEYFHVDMTRIQFDDVQE